MHGIFTTFFSMYLQGQNLIYFILSKIMYLGKHFKILVILFIDVEYTYWNFPSIHIARILDMYNIVQPLAFYIYLHFIAHKIMDYITALSHILCFHWSSSSFHSPDPLTVPFPSIQLMSHVFCWPITLPSLESFSLSLMVSSSSLLYTYTHRHKH